MDFIVKPQSTSNYIEPLCFCIIDFCNCDGNECDCYSRCNDCTDCILCLDCNTNCPVQCSVDVIPVGIIENK